MNEENFIKRLVELAEGFEYDIYDPLFCIMYGKKGSRTYKNKVREWEFYPLLLYRAMEGLMSESYNEGSRIKPLRIFIEIDNVRIFNCVTNGETYFGFKSCLSTEYLTPQEKALEAALKEVLK